MPKCAFLTIENVEGWFIDDEIVYPQLNELGWEVEDVVWHADNDWNQYDCVVIRSPWDYQGNLERFNEVLRTISNSNARLFNEIETVNWNVDKHYLFELQKSGIEIVPTLRFGQLSARDIAVLFESFDTDVVVVKPTIGANADDTFKIGRDASKELIADVCDIYSMKPCFAQPFMPAIVDEGEFSLIYFDGKFCHSILKTTKAGDFRVQEEHGGGVVAVAQPEPELQAAADKVMRALPMPVPLYARVDLVRTSKNSFALMEVELIEPCLYFRFSENAASIFANVIDSKHRNSP